MREPFRLAHPHYEDARKELLRKYRSSYCNCGPFTRVMASLFPELMRVAGFYSAPNGASQGEHWWLTDSHGTIVDPTADQFPSQGTGTYVEYDPKLHLLLKGKCMNCGTALYTRDGAYPCSRECDEALAGEFETTSCGGPYEEDMTFTSDADITTRYGLQFKGLPLNTKKEITCHAA